MGLERLELGESYVLSLRAEAVRVLRGDDPCPGGADIIRKQGECRMAEDDQALALWSRVRWLWLLATGQVKPDEYVLKRHGAPGT